jgi:hypothetical protein
VRPAGPGAIALHAGKRGDKEGYDGVDFKGACAAAAVRAAVASRVAQRFGQHFAFGRVQKERKECKHDRSGDDMRGLR